MPRLNWLLFEFHLENGEKTGVSEDCLSFALFITLISLISTFIIFMLKQIWSQMTGSEPVRIK